MANTKKMDCVILGLLSHESLTGYEIKQRMDSSLQMFWGASFGSIYPTLNSLLMNGYVTSKNINDNKREKISYTITGLGRDYLREWLKAPVEKDEIRYETLLKLFFGSENGVEGTLKHVIAFEQKIRKELEELQGSVQILEQIQGTQEAHLYYLLTAKFGVKTYEAYLEWCEEARTQLAKTNSET
jgi:DNA-binding PadR family transcriptional regulator